MIAIPQTLLILLVLGLFITMFYACFHSTKGSSSITNLVAHLNLLKIKFESHTPVYPEKERRMMEGLQNTIKANCSKKGISCNDDLKALFAFNCLAINGLMKTTEPSNKTQWLRYGALMNDFNDQYFSAKTNR